MALDFNDNALGGEAGEALNAGKKLRRLHSQIQQHGDAPRDIAEAERRLQIEDIRTVVAAHTKGDE